MEGNKDGALVGLGPGQRTWETCAIKFELMGGWGAGPAKQGALPSFPAANLFLPCLRLSLHTSSIIAQNLT